MDKVGWVSPCQLFYREMKTYLVFPKYNFSNPVSSVVTVDNTCRNEVDVLLIINFIRKLERQRES